MTTTILEAIGNIAAPPYNGMSSILYPVFLTQGYSYNFTLYSPQSADLALALVGPDGTTPCKFGNTGREIVSDNPMLGAGENFRIMRDGPDMYNYVRVSANNGHGYFLLKVEQY